MKTITSNNRLMFLFIFLLFSQHIYSMKRVRSSGALALYTAKSEYHQIFQSDDINLAQTKKLLKKGANPNAEIFLSTGPSTPLQIACFNGNFKLVKLLLKHKAEVNFPNIPNCYPLYFTFQGSIVDTKDSLYEQDTKNRKQIIKTLLKNNAYCSFSSLYYVKNKPLKALLVKHLTLYPDDLLEGELNQLIGLKKNIQPPLSLALLYSTTENKLIKDVNYLIFLLYTTLHNNERSQHWFTACDSVYGKESHSALLLLPFMTEQQQWKTCKAFYLGTEKTLTNTHKKMQN